MSKTTKETVYKHEHKTYLNNDYSYDQWKKEESQECEACGSIVPNIDHLALWFNEFGNSYWLCIECIIEADIKDYK